MNTSKYACMRRKPFAISPSAMVPIALHCSEGGNVQTAGTFRNLSRIYEVLPAASTLVNASSFANLTAGDVAPAAYGRCRTLAPSLMEDAQPHQHAAASSALGFCAGGTEWCGQARCSRSPSTVVLPLV